MELFYMNDEWLVRVWHRAQGSERRFARALGRAWAEDVASGAADVIVVGPEGGGDCARRASGPSRDARCCVSHGRSAERTRRACEWVVCDGVQIGAVE